MSEGGRGVNGQEGTIRKFVAYFRVSTDKQGVSGLGMDGQAAAVARYVAGVGGEVVDVFREVESGKRDDRPQLEAAMERCRRLKATLLIAKLDRLARRVSFITKLMEGGVEIVACDMPAANKAMLQMMAVFAEFEHDQISERTKAALAAAKARRARAGLPDPNNIGVWMAQGGDPGAVARGAAMAADVGLREFVLSRGGLSLRGLAAELDAAGHRPRGGAAKWSAEAVRQLRRRVCARSSEREMV